MSTLDLLGTAMTPATLPEPLANLEPTPLGAMPVSQASPNLAKMERLPGQHLALGGRAVVLAARLSTTTDPVALAETVGAVQAAGFKALHAGCFVPSRWAYHLQGADTQDLETLALASREHGLALIAEVLAPEHVLAAAQYADILQAGARSMQNYPLLHAIGACQKPVLLKRGQMSTLQELCSTADYVRSCGNSQIVLCERGIRTFAATGTDTFDVSAIPALRELSDLPIIADPSHGSGDWTHVGAMCQAAVAAGVDGLLLEIRPSSTGTPLDTSQAVPLPALQDLVARLRAIANAVGREI